MIAMVGWMMMAMASRAVRVFYAASNAPLTLEDDGGATLPLHATEAPRPQPAWVRAASEPDELQTEFSFAPAPEARENERREGSYVMCLFTQTASSPASE